MNNIEIIEKPAKELYEEILTTYTSEKDIEDSELDRKTINNIKSLLSNREIKETLKVLQNDYYIPHISFNSLAKIEEACKILSENISELKTQIELEAFLKTGYNLDIAALKKKFKLKGLKKDFPKLDFVKIKELYVNPPKYLPTLHDHRKKILIDPFVFRKYFIAILQMIFNKMDFVVCNVGDEGAGKSCKCSQDMYMLWWIMTEINLVDYKFELKEMFANTLNRFGELEDKYYGVPFRIIGLDEGNELNRQDWKEDSVKLFWQRLRRERHEQRIKFINIPVLGEMIINIVLSRVNFIFNSLNKNEPKTGTLYKGDYDFYIIPRGQKIFSPQWNKELSKDEIKNKLYTNLKDKEYLKGLPKDIKVKRCYCNGVWGFEEKEYIKEMKETNRKYTVTKGIRFGLSELYAFYKLKLSPAKIGLARKSPFYPSFSKMRFKINRFWNNDVELLQKYNLIYKHKEEEKLGPINEGGGKAKKKRTGGPPDIAPDSDR